LWELIKDELVTGKPVTVHYLVPCCTEDTISMKTDCYMSNSLYSSVKDDIYRNKWILMEHIHELMADKVYDQGNRKT
ncbi:hypothetical protein J0S82_007554, partial [Galemys pyrenaicus]